MGKRKRKRAAARQVVERERQHLFEEESFFADGGAPSPALGKRIQQANRTITNLARRGTGRK